MTFLLKTDEPAFSGKRVAVYILIAYLFALAVRSLLYFQAAGIADYRFDGHLLPIWSPDAGLYGYYAKQILAGHSYPFVSEYMPGHLVAFFVRTTGLSIDTLMFWLPALLSSLIVVPVVLIGRALRLTAVGFAAALIAGAGANYYTRSYLGYMDTDVLNLVLPWTAVMFWIYALTQKKLLHALAAAATLLTFRMWYHSSAAILAGMVLGLFLTVLVFYRKERIGWQSVLLAAAAAAPVPFLFTAGALGALSAWFAFFGRGGKTGVKPCLVLLGGGILAAPFFLDFGHYIRRAQDYLNKPETVDIVTQNGTLHFTDVLSTVIEAGGAPIWQINPLFTGMAFYIFPALAGFVLMAIRQHRALWIAAPLLALGLLSQAAGIRFAMFAGPALALGYAWLAFVLAQSLSAGTASKALAAGLTLAAAGLMLFNILKLNPYLKPFYFLKPEVKALHAFTAASRPNDLVLSWWDFGWPLWYYTGRSNTLLDNGRHGSDTFYVGNELLSANPVFVANSAKYAAALKAKRIYEVVPYIAQHGEIFRRFRFFSDPKYNPASPGNAYFLLHRDMLAYLPTIAGIADRDPRSGRPTRQRQFYLSTLLEPYSPASPIVRGDTFTLDLRNGVITGSDGASTRINTVAVSENGKLVAAQRYDARSPMFMILYDKTRALYMDGSVFGSFLIQALILDRYDKTRFEKVADTGKMKIFRVR